MNINTNKQTLTVDAKTTTDRQFFNWQLLWAKSEPRHPLWKHLLDTAALSLAFQQREGEAPAEPPVKLNTWTPEQTALIVALHDIGKVYPAFQHQVAKLSQELERETPYKQTSDPPCRHERISTTFIRKKLRDAGMSERDADTVGRAVVAHHGHWIETSSPVPEIYAAAQNAIFEFLKNTLGVSQLPSSVPDNHSAFGMRLAGHIVLCDWIASNEKFFTDLRIKDMEDPVSYFEKAREVARVWIEKLGFNRVRTAGNPASIVQSARPIQQALLDHDIPPSLVIIEAPMGEGKTEAAWILAEKWRTHGYHGMYMALPTMATSDSLYRRYHDNYLKAMQRGEDAKLVHGMAWLRDDLEPMEQLHVSDPGDKKRNVPGDKENRELATAWFRPTRRAMLSAHGVGTVDQAMLAGMHVKFGFLRLFGLADRVLVIDEVHAYDAYMSAIIARLLQWCACLKIPVILLSATLSAKQRAAMIEAYGATGGDPGPEAPYPLITVAEPEKEAWTISEVVNKGGEKRSLKASITRTLKIETHHGRLGDAKMTAQQAMNLVQNGGCCCVILNTVKQAQAIYRELKLKDGEKLLFHARFTAADRQKKTKKVLAMFGKDSTCRPSKFVLVATQVVEQSLDVDFDHMISEIAPIDLLLQRNGRLHRHRKREHDPILHVLLPDEKELVFGGTGYVYAEKPLLRTLAILAGRNEIQLPSDFRTLIEQCYGLNEWEQEAVGWEAIRKADQNWNKETESLHNQGRLFALCEPSKRIFRPVNNDPTGDDSDDGNGWRAKTRLGANDRTAVFVAEEQLHLLEPGELRMKQVRALYRRSLKLPTYLPIFSPASGYSAAVEAKGKLRGLILLPLTNDGLWRGRDEKGNYYAVTYDKRLGLLAGRAQ